MPEVVLCESNSIRDSTVHTSLVDASLAVGYWKGDGKPTTIRVDNSALGVNLTVWVFGNRLPTSVSGVQIGNSFVVTSNNQQMRGLSQDTSSWFPNIYLGMQAATTPAAGRCRAYLMGEGVMP